MSIIKTIRTYIFWLIIFCLFLPPCFLLSLLPKSVRYRNRLYFWLTKWWGKLLLFFAFVEVKARGKHHLPTQPAIFVMNHSSALDIPLVEGLLGSHPRVWVSRDTYGKIPVFGTVMSRMHVLVNRKRSQRTGGALAKLYRLAKVHNSHVLIFPEGKRSMDGKLGKFFEGFAVLASKLKRPVVPIAITGVHKIMPANSFFINPRASKVRLEIGRPTCLDKIEDHKIFVETMKRWFEEKV